MSLNPRYIILLLTPILIALTGSIPQASNGSSIEGETASEGDNFHFLSASDFPNDIIVVNKGEQGSLPSGLCGGIFDRTYDVRPIGNTGVQLPYNMAVINTSADLSPGTRLSVAWIDYCPPYNVYEATITFVPGK